MIRIYGDEDTREYQAALSLRAAILACWPSVASDHQAEIHLVAGAKCHGQRKRDVDILMLGYLGSEAEYQPYLAFHTGGGLNCPQRVEVQSFCLAIELKDHAPEDVRFLGNTVEVRYRDDWKNVSEQNHGQTYAVKGYLESRGLHAPFITSLIWLRNVPNAQLPPRPHNVLGAAITWNLVLNVVGQLSPPRRSARGWVLQAFDHQSSLPTQVIAAFTQSLVPTRLDRLRMERITRQVADELDLSKRVGQKLLLLRGRGGTGKTVRLLQLAKRLFDKEAARVLILTYNKALTADIRRQLTFLSVPDDVASSSIQVQTCHSFFLAILSALGISAPLGTSALEAYDDLLRQGLEAVRESRLSPTDLRILVEEHPSVLFWDYVFVDEGQDWPEEERDFLLSLFAHRVIAVADGLEQLVRSGMPCDWRAGLPRTEVDYVSLDTCLRMKSGLSRFVTAVARHLSLATEGMNPNVEAPGGRVIVVDGSYLSVPSLHNGLVARNADDGNCPVDMLFCVPPSLVCHPVDGGEVRSAPARVFESWSQKVWDGVSTAVRDSYPTDVDQLRVLQYESCRGLEGWTAVLLHLDDLYQHKVERYALDALQDSRGTRRDPDAGHRFAARWAMIPLTRAIDTLVIEIHQPQSRLRTALERAHAECRDFAEWITV